jgi:hypothetical protein
MPVPPKAREKKDGGREEMQERAVCNFHIIGTVDFWP